MAMPFVERIVAAFPIIILPSSLIALADISSSAVTGIPIIILEATWSACASGNDIKTCPRTSPVTPIIIITESLANSVVFTYGLPIFISTWQISLITLVAAIKKGLIYSTLNSAIISSQGLYKLLYSF